jgi:hypothetical protein
MPIKVYVTRNLPFSSGMGFGDRGTGHAALEVSTTQASCYISYYGQRPEFAGDYNTLKRQHNNNKLAMFRALQEREFNNLNDIRIGYPNSYADDRVLGFNSKSRCIEIPALGEIKGAPEIGLNPQRICDWWNITKANQRSKFNMISKTMNCASTVMCALWAGGATNYKDYYRVLWVSPRNVRDYAESLREKIETVGQEYANLLERIAEVTGNGNERQLRKLVNNANSKMKNFNKTTRTDERELDECRTTNGLGFYDLMTVADWKRLSYVKMSLSTGFATRNEQIAKIDKYLAKYHAITWGTSVEGDSKKAGYILEMMKYVRQHMTRKADSKRGDAVMKFGHQLTRTWGEMLQNEKKQEAEKEKLRIEAELLEQKEKEEAARQQKQAQMGMKATAGAVNYFLAKYSIIKKDPNLRDINRNMLEIHRQIGAVLSGLQPAIIQSLKQEIWGDPNYQPTVNEISDEAFIAVARSF